MPTETNSTLDECANLHSIIGVEDIKIVEFDVFIDVDGNPNSQVGWGKGLWGRFSWGLPAVSVIPDTLQPEQTGWNSGNNQAWDTFGWNSSGLSDGFTGVPNTVRRGKFVMYVGAANRFINIQEADFTKDIQGLIGDSDIRYSEYSNILYINTTNVKLGIYHKLSGRGN